MAFPVFSSRFPLDPLQESEPLAFFARFLIPPSMEQLRELDSLVYLALKRGFKRISIRKIRIFDDFLSNFYPGNRPKAVRKTGLKHSKNLPEAFPEQLEIANKPVSMGSDSGFGFCPRFFTDKKKKT